MSLKVLVSLVLPATLATVAALNAGNELLLRERKELSSLDEVLSLNGSSSSEGPA